MNISSPWVSFSVVVGKKRPRTPRIGVFIPSSLDDGRRDLLGEVWVLVLRSLRGVEGPLA